MQNIIVRGIEAQGGLTGGLTKGGLTKGGLTKGGLTKGGLTKGGLTGGLTARQLINWRVESRGLKTSRAKGKPIGNWRGKLLSFTTSHLAKISQLLLFVFLCIFLAACGGGGGSKSTPSSEATYTPTHNPIAKTQSFNTTGTAALGLVNDAQITAYAIPNGAGSCAYNSLDEVGMGRSGSNGQYNLTISRKIDDVFWLLRLTGGSYFEEASGAEVHLKDRQALYAIGTNSSQDKSIAISPLSSIQAGLFCYLIEQGEYSNEEAHAMAKEFITSYIGFDPRYVSYKDPTAAIHNHASLQMDNGLKLGLLNAGISQYSYDISRRIEGAGLAHHNINSAYMAQHFFNDIYQDGMLDGKDPEITLFIGIRDYVEPLSTASYLLDLPKAVLKFYDSNANNEVSAGRSLVYAMADQMNSAARSSASTAFPKADEMLALDREAPQISWLSPTELSGKLNITLQVTDLTSVYEITLSGHEDINIENTEGNIYSFAIDTSVYNSGEQQLSFAVADTLGNNATTVFDIIIINDAPSLRITSPDIAKDSSYSLSFDLSKVHPQQRIDHSNSGCILLSGEAESLPKYPIERAGGNAEGNTETGFSCDIELHQGINSIQVVLCDSYSLCNRSSFYSVKYDTTPPEITAIDLEDIYRGNVTFRVEVTDALSDIVGLPKYSVTGNGQELEGQAEHLNNTEYKIHFDASRFGNRDISIVVSAVDEENNEVSVSFATSVVNKPAKAQLVSATTFSDDQVSFNFAINQNSYRDIEKVTCTVPSYTPVNLAEYSVADSSASCSLYVAKIPDGEVDLHLSICGKYKLCSSQTFKILKDATPPSISFIDVKDSYEITGEVITIDIGDANLDEASLKYKIDEQEQQSLIQQGDKWIITLPPTLTTGRHQITIFAEDRLGNSAEVTQEILLLLDEPDVNLVSTPLTKDAFYTLTARIDPKTYTGEYTGICFLNEVIDVATIRNNILSCNINLVNIEDGEHTIDIDLTADYGTDYRRQLHIIKDSAKPSISFADIKDSYERTGDTITIDIGDDNLDEASLKYRINNNAQQSLIQQGDKWTLTLPPSLTTGKHQITIFAEDRLGNSAATTQEFLLLLDEPGLTLVSELLTKDVTYTLTARINPKTYTGKYTAFCYLNRVPVPAIIIDDLLSCNINLVNIEDGEHTIDIALSADYGRSYRQELSITKDTSPPSIRFANIKSSYGRIGDTITLDIGDANLDSASLMYRIDEQEQQPLVKQGDKWTLTLPPSLTTGRHRLTIFAEDRLGNSAEITQEFLLLLDEPDLTLTSEALTKGDAYTLTARIDPRTYVGDYSAVCSLNDVTIAAPISSNILTCNINLVDVADGEHEIDIVLTPDYGRSYSRQLQITKDTTSPSIRFANIKSSYERIGDAITLGIEDANLDEASLMYSIDEQEQQPLVKQGDKWTLTLPPSLTTGRRQITIFAEDSLANSAEITQDILLLLDEPVVNLTSTPLTNDDDYTLTARINPHTYVGDYSATCSLDDVTVAAPISNNILVCNINLVDANDGEHEIGIAITADYGISYESALTIVKDASKPSIRFTDLKNRYEATGDAITLGIEDANLDEASLMYRIDEQEQQPLVKQGDKWTLTLPPSLTTGNHRIVITASDSLANSAEITQEILLLLDEPDITLTSTSLTKDDAYTLTARINPRTYTGDYTATCSLNRVSIPAKVSNNIITCNINLADVNDGEHTIDIALTADYGISYESASAIVKDASKPIIRFTDLKNRYELTGEVITLNIRDNNLDETSLKYRINDNPQKSLIKQGDNWIITLPPTLTTGRHQLTITASDRLANSAEITQDILLLLDEPTASLTSEALTKEDAYTLTARINPRTYTGEYTATCSLNRVSVPAEVDNNLLTCNINLVGANDGRHDIGIVLTADYGRSYRQELRITKDTTPPDISCPFNSGYDASVFRTHCEVRDEHSRVASFSYRKPLNRNEVIELSRPYRITLDPSSYPDGSYMIEVTAIDEAGNIETRAYPINIDKTPPTLAIPARIHTQENIIDIRGTYEESELAEIICLKNELGQDLDIIATIQEDNSFVCEGYAVTNMNQQDTIEVRACDIYDNCRSSHIRVLHDSRLPIGNVDAGHSNYMLALPDNDSPNIINPSIFSLDRAKTFINASDVNIEYLQNNNYAFVSWQGLDASVQIPHPLLSGIDKQLYTSNPSNLTFHYSYSQRNCVRDNPGNSYFDVCPEENTVYYFRNKKLSGQIIDAGLARVIIPLTDEYLSADGKPLWYLAPVADTIHRIDLYICDEARNCLQYIARFKVNLLATGPVITDLAIPHTSINLLKDVNSYITASHNSPIVTRVFEISNPSKHPVFFTLAANQEATNLKILRRKYRRINAYYRRTTKTTYVSRTQTYSANESSNDRFRCNYETISGSRGATIEIFSDRFPASSGNVYTSREVRRGGRCYSGGSRTHSYTASGYPKNVDADYKNDGSPSPTGSFDREMSYHSALDENNVPYHPDSYYQLDPGTSKRIIFRETLPNYSIYRDGDLPVPDDYDIRLGYNWKAASYLNNKLAIKFGRADLSGLLEESSVITYTKDAGPITEVTTNGRFTVLDGTPE